MPDDQKAKVISFMPAKSQRKQPEQRRVINDDCLCEIIDLSAKKKERRPWYKSRRIQYALALTLGAGILYYFTARESSLEQQINAVLQPLKQEFTYACNQDTDFTTLESPQERDWITARKDEILRSYGCDPAVIQWYCSSSMSFSKMREENAVSVTCADMKKVAQFDIADAQHGTGIWSYRSWKAKQEKK